MPMPRGNKFVLNGGKIRSLQRLLRLIENNKDFGWKKPIGFSTYRQSHRILERLARLLWKAHDPLGAIHLADLLRLWGMSTEDKSLNTFTYAAALYSEWLPRFVKKKHKSADDNFLLGMHYMRGSKITPSPTAARLCFRRAMTAGLPHAHHELAWSMAMDLSIPIQRSIAEFRRVLGPTKKDSLASATLLEFVFFRLNEEMATAPLLDDLKKALQCEVYSSNGMRFINVRIEAWLKAQTNLHQKSNNPESWFVLGLIEDRSRAKPTGATARQWYVKAASGGHPDAMLAYLETGPSASEWAEVCDSIRRNGHPIPAQVSDQADTLYCIGNAIEEGDADH